MGTLIDYITGQSKPDIGAEGNRQLVERVLVEDKGYARNDIAVDRTIRLEMEDGPYTSSVDLVVYVKGKAYMAIKCAPGSLGSRQREIVSAARLLEEFQIPLAVASSGKDAFVWDTVSGHQVGEGLLALPTKIHAETTFDPKSLRSLPPDRIKQIQLIFRSYDSMNVNR